MDFFLPHAKTATLLGMRMLNKARDELYAMCTTGQPAPALFPANAGCSLYFFTLFASHASNAWRARLLAAGRPGTQWQAYITALLEKLDVLLQ
jgi:hypothetical protein